MNPKLPDPEFTLIPVSPIRKAVAEWVTSSFRDMPQFDVQAEIDNTALVKLRNLIRTRFWMS
jgi:pyruvate/2-oxoglutarate dehydrogenase complex dihydrolipoamide acyltransferase (E2) component